MEGVALRLWNAYGPGQALSNPYTGVLAIFASRIHNGAPPVVFEDGRQRRDFVHVEDVAQAFVLALEQPEGGGRGLQHRQRRATARSARWRTFSRRRWAGPTSSRRSRERPGSATSATTSRTSPRPGPSSATRPAKDFSEGLAELAEWVAEQQAEDRVGEARHELERGASWHERPRDTPACPGPRRPAAGPRHRRSRLHRLQPRRPARPRRPRRAGPRRARPPGRRAQPRLAARAPPAADLGRDRPTSGTRRLWPMRPARPRPCSTSPPRSR